MAKKTKKIETPIDQRETFVSIRKSFADSDITVSEKLKTLYALQLADLASSSLISFSKVSTSRGSSPLS